LSWSRRRPNLIERLTARVAELERRARIRRTQLVRRVVGFHTGGISGLARCCANLLTGAGNAVTSSKESLIPIPTQAAQNGAVATDAAVGQVNETVAAAFTPASRVAGDSLTRGTEPLTPIVQSAAGRAQELSDGVAAEFKKIAGGRLSAGRPLPSATRRLGLPKGRLHDRDVRWSPSSANLDGIKGTTLGGPGAS
jgi:hypothetical protein